MTKLYEHTFALRRPNSFDFVTRKVINPRNTITLPPSLKENDPLEHIRDIQSFERWPPQARKIPEIDEILAQDMLERGMTTNLTSDDLVSKLFNKFMDIPKFDIIGNPVMDSLTGKQMVETKSLGQMLKTFNGSLEANKKLLSNLKREIRNGSTNISDTILLLQISIERMMQGISNELRKISQRRITPITTTPIIPTAKLLEGMNLFWDALDEQKRGEFEGPEPSLIVSMIDTLPDQFTVNMIINNPEFLKKLAFRLKNSNISPKTFFNFLIEKTSIGTGLDMPININSFTRGLLNIQGASISITSPTTRLPTLFPTMPGESDKPKLIIPKEKLKLEKDIEEKKMDEGPDLNLPKDTFGKNPIVINVNYYDNLKRGVKGNTIIKIRKLAINQKNLKARATFEYSTGGPHVKLKEGIKFLSAERIKDKIIYDDFEISITGTDINNYSIVLEEP